MHRTRFAFAARRAGVALFVFPAALLASPSGLRAAEADVPEPADVAAPDASQAPVKPPPPRPEPKVTVTVEPPPAAEPADDAPTPGDAELWTEHDPVPRGYHRVWHPNGVLVAAGAAPLSLLYLLSVLVAASTHGSNIPGGPSYDALFVPGVGPFVTLGTMSNVNLFNPLVEILVLDGLVQAGGITLMVAGLSSGHTVLEPDRPSALRLMPRPMLVGRDGAGFGWRGAF